MLFDLLRGADYGIWDIVIYILSSLAVVFLTMPVHEAAHGFAASKLGDPTARYQGRLTLNPLAHIDPVGAVCIILFGFGWAKPVPVNVNYFNNPKRDMALTALAGPVSNLLLALAAFLLMNVVYALGYALHFSFTVIYYICMFLQYIALINISLAVFNLIPIPPLDGSRLLTAVLPNRIYYRLMQYERYFFLVLIALLWTGILDIPLSFLSRNIGSALAWLAHLPFSALF